MHNTLNKLQKFKIMPMVNCQEYNYNSRQNDWNILQTSIDFLSSSAPPHDEF